MEDSSEMQQEPKMLPSHPRLSSIENHSEEHRKNRGEGVDVHSVLWILSIHVTDDLQASESLMLQEYKHRLLDSIF